jgi:hypothetical protein
MADLFDGHEEPNRSGQLWAIAGVALAGALVTYALRTPRGRRMFDEALVILDDFSASCSRFSEACTRAQLAASDSWSALRGATTFTSTRAR